MENREGGISRKRVEALLSGPHMYFDQARAEAAELSRVEVQAEMSELRSRRRRKLGQLGVLNGFAAFAGVFIDHVE